MGIHIRGIHTWATMAALKSPPRERAVNAELLVL
jgi:hypothetical protein